MTGVEILATQEVVSNSIFNWGLYLICAGVVFVIFVIVGLFNTLSEGDFEYFAVFIIAGVVCGAIIGLIPGTAFEIPTEYETQYKVTITDEVPMNDFLERYEIISQEGKIYTVRERNNGK